MGNLVTGMQKAIEATAVVNANADATAVVNANAVVKASNNMHVSPVLKDVVKTDVKIGGGIGIVAIVAILGIVAISQNLGSLFNVVTQISNNGDFKTAIYAAVVCFAVKYLAVPAATATKAKADADTEAAATANGAALAVPEPRLPVPGQAEPQAANASKTKHMHDSCEETWKELGDEALADAKTASASVRDGDPEERDDDPGDPIGRWSPSLRFAVGDAVLTFNGVCGQIVALWPRMQPWQRDEFDEGDIVEMTRSDKEWYAGSVIRLERSKRQMTVKFDDGEEHLGVSFDDTELRLAAAYIIVLEDESVVRAPADTDDFVRLNKKKARNGRLKKAHAEKKTYARTGKLPPGGSLCKRGD